MARKLGLNVAGVCFRRRESLGFVRMAAEHPVIVTLTPEPDNAHDKFAVRVIMAVKAKPEETWHVGYIPKSHSMYVSQLLSERPVSTKLMGSGTVKGNDDTPWFRIELGYSLPGKRESRTLVSDFTQRLLAATDQATVEAIKGEVLAAKDRILPDQLDALRSAYISTLHRLRREQAEVGKGVD